MSTTFSRNYAIALEAASLSFSSNCDEFLILDGSDSFSVGKAIPLNLGIWIQIAEYTDGGKTIKELEVGDLVVDGGIIPLPFLYAIDLDLYPSVQIRLDQENEIVVVVGVGISVIDTVDPVEIKIVRFPIKDRPLQLFKKVVGTENELVFSFHKEGLK